MIGLDERLRRLERDQDLTGDELLLALARSGWAPAPASREVRCGPLRGVGYARDQFRSWSRRRVQLGDAVYVTSEGLATAWPDDGGSSYYLGVAVGWAPGSAAVHIGEGRFCDVPLGLGS